MKILILDFILILVSLLEHKILGISYSDILFISCFQLFVIGFIQAPILSSLLLLKKFFIE